MQEEVCISNVANTATDSIYRKRGKAYNKSGCCNAKGSPGDNNLYFVCNKKKCQPGWRGSLVGEGKTIPDLNKHGKEILKWLCLNCESMLYIIDGKDIVINSCPEDEEDSDDCEAPSSTSTCSCPSCIVQHIRVGHKYICALRKESHYLKLKVRDKSPSLYCEQGFVARVFVSFLFFPERKGIVFEPQNKRRVNGNGLRSIHLRDIQVLFKNIQRMALTVSSNKVFPSTPTRYPNRSSIILGRTMMVPLWKTSRKSLEESEQNNHSEEINHSEENAEEQNNSDNNANNRVPSGDISSGEESVYDEDEEQIQHVLDDDDKDKEISKLKKENEDLNKTIENLQEKHKLLEEQFKAAEAKRIEDEKAAEAKRIEDEKAAEAKRIEDEKAAKRIEDEKAAKRIEDEKAAKRIEDEKAAKRIEDEKAAKRIEDEKAAKKIKTRKQ